MHFQDAEDYQSQCADAFTTVQAAISEWQDGGVGVPYSVYYDSCESDDLSLCEADCSPDRDDNSTCTCDEVADMIGDIGSVRAEAFTHATDYKDYSTGTVSSMTAYALARAAYDAEYLDNNTQGLQDAILNALRRISFPHIKTMNITFADLFLNVDEPLFQSRTRC